MFFTSRRDVPSAVGSRLGAKGTGTGSTVLHRHCFICASKNTLKNVAINAVLGSSWSISPTRGAVKSSATSTIPLLAEPPGANEGESATKERNREENLKLERLRKPTK